MNKKQKTLLLILLIIIFGLTTYLFYMQAIGRFNSDLILHIKSALENGSDQYTITKPLYRILYTYFGGNISIALFLSFVEILTIYVTKKALDFYNSDMSSKVKWLLSITLNFVIAIYVPFIHKAFNAGVQEPTEWHNSTYMCMKLLGIFIILLYFKIEKNYLKRISFKNYVIFCASLILVNSIKPNFILAFAPTMLIFLIIDFIKNYKNKTAIKNMIVFGSAVLISLIVLIYQSMVLYGSDDGSGITIGFMTLLKQYHRYPIISLIQSAAFPVFIYSTNIKKVLKNKKYLFILILNFVALLEYLLLQETGVRALDGNFDWGYSFSLMMFFISSISLLYEVKQENLHSKKYYILAYLIFALHFVSGIIYFIRLLLGFSY